MRLDSHRIRSAVGDNSFELVQPGIPEDIGSESHRQRLETYARARLRRPSIHLSFSAVCRSCAHSHEGQICPTCSCSSYQPGGSSFTDMQGSITIQSDLPPDGTAAEHELCIRGLLRHEICHEARTDPFVHKSFAREMEELTKNGKEITAMQLQRIWNTLEDGMIEERERAEQPSSYSYISALNRLYPRVGRENTLTEELVLPAPDGYKAEDAHGNKLKIVDENLVIPAGTKLATWGKKPPSRAMQMEAALLASAVPEFSPGELHPDVQKCLDECLPYLDKGVGGNTADCVAAAYPIHAIIRRHGFLRDDLSAEERKQIDDLIKALGNLIPTVPEPGQATPGSGATSLYPSQKTPDQEEMSEQLEEAVDGDARAGQEDEEGENAGEDTGEGLVGGRQTGGGYDPLLPLPRSAREENERRGRGRVDKEKLADMKSKADREIAKDKSNQQLNDQRDQRAGRYGANSWQMPEGQKVFSQQSLCRGGEEQALSSETGALSILGRRLSAILERIKTQTRSPQTHRRRGRIDSRRLAAAVSGNPRVFSRPGTNLNVDLELDIIVDRSGSVTSSQVDNDNQYRMTFMFATAAKQTKIPTTIYGFDGSGWSAGQTCHYAYKENYSDDLRSLDSFFRTGGGGTPTADGIEFARARLAKSKAGHRAIICITDGAASDINAASEQCRLAHNEGLVVIGLAFSCATDQMNQQFGPGNWLIIDDYMQAPLVVGELIERLAKSQSSRSR